MLNGIVITPVRPADAAALEVFYEGLGEDVRYLRFHGLTCPSLRTCASFCAADGQTRAGFLAWHGGAIVGHACLDPLGDGRAELGIAVADGMRGQGVGSALLAAIEAWARTHGIRRICASVLAVNGPMAALMAHLGHVESHCDGYLPEVELEVALAR